jgi:hypothetical protein
MSTPAETFGKTLRSIEEKMAREYFLMAAARLAAADGGSLDETIRLAIKYYILLQRASQDDELENTMREIASIIDNEVDQEASIEDATRQAILLAQIRGFIEISR